MSDTLPQHPIGILDVGNLQLVDGWAFDPANPGAPVEIEILERDRLICRVLADKYRPDLEQSGFGDGRHAFHLELPEGTFASPVVELRLRIRSTGAPLAGTPLLLVNRQVMLTEETLAEMASAITGTVEAAQSGKELHGLALWLLRQLDTVWGRQAALESSARARSNRFYEMVGENGTLSTLLRDAAQAVMARYEPLHLPEPAQPGVTVIIPAHDGFPATHRCLAALLRHPPNASLEVILADDGSTDETVYAGFLLSGGIRVLRTGARGGAARAINLAAADARGQHLLVLQNNVEVAEGWLDELLAAFALDPSIGITGSRLLRPDGRLLSAGCEMSRHGVITPRGEGGDPARPEHRGVRDADALSGAALLVPRALFQQVGGLSEAYGSSAYAFADLCFKLRAAGRRIVVQPSSCAVQHGADEEAVPARLDRHSFVVAWAEALQRFPLPLHS